MRKSKIDKKNADIGGGPSFHPDLTETSARGNNSFRSLAEILSARSGGTAGKTSQS